MPDILIPKSPNCEIAFLHEQWEKLTDARRQMWRRHSSLEWDSFYFHRFSISSRLFNRYSALVLYQFLNCANVNDCFFIF